MDPVKTFWLIPVCSCVDPSLAGPYADEAAQDTAARRIREEQSDDDSLFWLIIDTEGRPEIGAYTNGFFEAAQG